jgi:hypothetical protein
MPLASKNNLGWKLGEPGVMTEGWFVTTAKALFRINSLGAFGEEQGAPTLTTEGPWGSRDLGARVQAQVLAVRGVARYFDGARSTKRGHGHDSDIATRHR